MDKIVHRTYREALIMIDIVGSNRHAESLHEVQLDLIKNFESHAVSRGRRVTCTQLK